MRAKLCATVTGKTMEEVRTRRDETDGVDLIELRLDYVDTPDVAGALAGRQVPVVVTCRPTWEGGYFRGAEEERRRILQQALDLGAEYVDFEWQGGFDDLVKKRDGRNVVLSNHDFEDVPDDLETRYRAMRATGAEVIKMAVLARRLSDSLDLMDLGAGSDDARVLVAMGPAGVPSRLLPDRFGSAWTYAGVGVAPGQLGHWSHARRVQNSRRFGCDRTVRRSWIAAEPLVVARDAQRWLCRQRDRCGLCADGGGGC